MNAEPIDPIRFSVVVDPAESRRFAAHVLLRRPSGVSIGFGGTLVVVAASLAGRDSTHGDVAHALFETVLAVAAALYLARLVRTTYGRIVARGKQEVTYTFSEDGVACEGDHATWWLPWPSVAGYVRRPDGYYFTFGASYVPVPLRAIPRERATEFAALVLRRGRRSLEARRP